MPCIKPLLVSLRRVLEANPGRSHGGADTLPLRHSANLYIFYTVQSHVKLSIKLH